MNLLKLHFAGNKRSPKATFNLGDFAAVQFGGIPFLVNAVLLFIPSTQLLLLQRTGHGYCESIFYNAVSYTLHTPVAR
jgi:hypothetical protein